MIFNHEPIINVGILLDTNLNFQLKGDFLMDNEVIKADNYLASIEGDTINTPFTTKKDITLKPKDKHSTFRLMRVKIGIGFHWEQTEEQEFEGGLTLQIEEGKIRAINTIPLESYLKSVISSEMSAMNDLNLLKAHAIVSRSWLLAQIIKGKSKEVNQETAISKTNNQEVVKWYDREDHATFDVCADDHCQRYQGITKIISTNAQKAIEATCGKVLMYNNEICDARFSKCCGGISEDFENVWQPIKVPYLTAVFDRIPDQFKKPEHIESFITNSPEAFCNTSDKNVLSQVLIDFDQRTTDFFRWKVTYSQSEISQLIRKKSGIDLGSILDLTPIERGKSGRIIRLKITGSKQSLIVGKELEIRKWLSETHLYSSAFIVEKNQDPGNEIPTSFLLRGAGWGHGVGMCQIGAAVMSGKGFSYKEILSHYFNNTHIEQGYNQDE
jgi:SpoIID/LytB domain protein